VNTFPSKDGSIIDTPAGPTFIRRIGRGPPVYVIHGGPGFDHSYLIEPLRSVAERRTLIFYDQPGCGGTPARIRPPSALSTFNHFRALVGAVTNQGAFGVIAHSWGALVLAGALAPTADAMPPIADPAEGLLINPVPVTSEAYKTVQRRQASRIPSWIRLKVLWLALDQRNGPRILKLLLPSYTAHDYVLPPDDPFPLDIRTYRATSSTLNRFDFSTGMSRLKQLAIVQGEDDFTKPPDIAAMIKAAKHLEILKAAGHFPFWDSPDAFAGALARAFPASHQ
jgi:pimeloyl-ACP methyl ester carboxylesterase